LSCPYRFVEGQKDKEKRKGLNMESNHIRSSMIERNTMEEFLVTLYDEDGHQVAVYTFTNYKDAENCVKKWYEHD